MMNTAYIGHHEYTTMKKSEQVIASSVISRSRLKELSPGDIRLRDLEIALAVMLVLAANEDDLLNNEQLHRLRHEFKPANI
jgi:hypothetical protein